MINIHKIAMKFIFNSTNFITENIEDALVNTQENI